MSSFRTVIRFLKDWVPIMCLMFMRRIINNYYLEQADCLPEWARQKSQFHYWV